MTSTQTANPQTATIRFHAAPRPVQATFRLLERTAPAIGARWAERIWFTLPRRPPSPPPAAPAGTAFTLDAAGHRIVGDRWGDGPTVYLVHGWAGQAGQFDAFVAPLVARGLRVVAFDAPSHGRSGPGAFGPRSSTLPELASALSAVIAEHGPAHAIVAHSMGANAAAGLLYDGLGTGRVAMLAPMASVSAYARRFATVLGAGEAIRRRLVARIERRVGVGLDRFEVPDYTRTVAMPPTLILHDRQDTTIPVADGAAIAATWPSARLRLSSGLGHRRLLRDPASVAEVVDFVAGRDSAGG